MPEMKTHYKYVQFREQSEGHWVCLNNRRLDELGQVVYNARWRRFVYQPTVSAIYSAGCLRDIAEFIENRGN